MNIQRCRNSVDKSGRILLLIACVALIFSGMSTAMAQSTDSEKFSVSLGVFITDRESRASLDGEVPDSGTDVDLENDLGFDKSDSVFRVDGYYRFNDKHRLDFSVFDLSRNGSKQIDEELIWDGEIYPIDVLVEGKLDVDIYKLAYTWSFMRRDKGYLGLSAGLYVADIGTSIAAESIGQSSSGTATAPLPVFGLRGKYDLSEKWSFRGSAEFFVFEYDDFSGSLSDIYAGVDYQLFEHAAVGVGYNRVTFDIGVAKTNFNGNLDWRYDGGLLFLKFDF